MILQKCDFRSEHFKSEFFYSNNEVCIEGSADSKRR